MKKWNIRWQLVAYDLLILLFVDFLLLYLYRSREDLSFAGVAAQAALSFVCIFSARFIGQIYRQIWRYGGIQCYIRLLAVDGCAFLVNLALERLLPIPGITFARLLSVSCVNLLCALAIRMFYRYAYKCANVHTPVGKWMAFLLRIFGGADIMGQSARDSHRIRVAIIGAGRVGVALAEELINNENAVYVPRCFVDIDPEKAGRSIHGIPVLSGESNIITRLREYDIQEVVFALPNLHEADKQQLYHLYSQAGFNVRVYDFPVMQTAGSKRSLREFDIEELLFRKPVILEDADTIAYYSGKRILITGGGGSIGSELCRQLAKMQPKRIVILDIYENGAYDVQQELKISYGSSLDLQVEIASVTNRRAMEKVFSTHRPQIVIHAAAHKHVPMMEHNVIEAVENNVFGTELLVEFCEAYGVERFMMVSTDKAVNPTNIMGATKRMCEMIVQTASTHGRVKYSSTRFGNVLGSAGSVIPLFKRQIANGGPITITDKRIIRYFMTIPEASQLVLQSGAMADNGELFVLDMGQPVKILDLAENMIRLAGANDIQIIETGLRPGEKLYEELLVHTEVLDKTKSRLIFIERDTPLAPEELQRRLELLRRACATNSEEAARKALHQAVPTFLSPEIINATAEASQEMQNCKEPASV